MKPLSRSSLEKIVAPFENVHEDWAVHGTTGYEMLNLIGGLFVDRASAEFKAAGSDRPFPGLRRPLAAGALADEIERFGGFTPHRLDIDAQNLAAKLEYAAIHNHCIHISVGRRVQYC